MLPKFLSGNMPIIESFFYVPKFCLSIIGYWPEYNLTILLILRAIFSLFVLCFGTFGEFAFGFINIKDMLMAFDAFCPAATKFVTAFKLIIFWLYRQQCWSLILQLRDIIQDAAQNSKQIQIIQSNYIRGATLSAIVFIFSLNTNLSYCTRPLLTNVIQYFTNQNITLEMPFKIAASDILLHEFPGYPITYIILSLSGFVTIFGFCGVDSFFVGYCYYIAGIFDILKYDIEEIFQNQQIQSNATNNNNEILTTATTIETEIETRTTTVTKVENQICFNKLKLIIERHNSIMNLCDKFTSFYAAMVLLHFLSASIVICLSTIDLMLNSGFGIVLYVFYSLAALFQLFIYCMGGTCVIDSSSNLGIGIYGVDWYKYDLNVRRVVILIIIRSQRPSSISVPFFAPSLSAFGTVLSTTGSYVTLMKTFL